MGKYQQMLRPGFEPTGAEVHTKPQFLCVSATKQTRPFAFKNAVRLCSYQIFQLVS
jgi:hypothetical protein